MIGQAIWKNLQTLINIDKQLTDTKKEIEHTQQILDRDHKTIPQLETKITEVKRNLLNEKKNIALLELEAESLKEKEKSKKETLEKITNPKAYKSLEKEIKTISQQMLEQDNLLMQAWHNLDAIKEKAEKSEKEMQEKIIQLKEGIEVQQGSFSDQEKKVKKLQKNRKLALKLISEEWLDKYERMRHKVQDPIVPIIGSSCSACYYSILRKDLCKLKKSGVLLCRNCYRFLYYNEEEETEAKQENF